MNEQTIFIRKASILAADMNGETVMMDIDSGKYYNLGPIGGRIWELLEKPCTLAGLVDALVQEYEVSPVQCMADVLPFLQQMLDAGILTEKVS